MEKKIRKMDPSTARHTQTVWRKWKQSVVTESLSTILNSSFLLIFKFFFMFSGSQLIVVILCILTLVLVIAIALVLIKCIPKFCNISDWIAQNLGSDSTVNSNGSSGSLLKNNLANGNSFVLMSIFVEYYAAKIKVLADALIVPSLTDRYIWLKNKQETSTTFK